MRYQIPASIRIYPEFETIYMELYTSGRSPCIPPVKYAINKIFYSILAESIVAAGNKIYAALAGIW